jgi:hypothetical protein
MRNYKKERENYHSRPEQMIRNAARKRARRQMEKAGIAKRFDGKDIHHKDNNPENNDLNNLSLVTQNYNRKEPRLREKKLKDLQAKLTAALSQTENVQEGLSDPQELAKEIEWAQSSKNVDSKVLSREQKKFMREIAKFMNRLRNPDWISKFNEIYNKRSDKLVQQRLKLAVKKVGFSSGLVKKLFKEDMGSVTGPHIAGTGDDNTVHTKPKKKVKKRISLIKGMRRKR